MPNYTMQDLISIQRSNNNPLAKILWPGNFCNLPLPDERQTELRQHYPWTGRLKMRDWKMKDQIHQRPISNRHDTTTK